MSLVKCMAFFANPSIAWRYATLLTFSPTATAENEKQQASQLGGIQTERLQACFSSRQVCKLDDKGRKKNEVM